MKQFKNKVALITGAGNGFGAEFAKEAHRRGMKLLLADIDEADVRRTQETILADGGTAGICVVDVSLESDVQLMVDQAIAAFGRIDLLINDAGVAFGGDITELPTRDWEWIIGTNNLSQIYSMKRVIPIMEKQGSPCYIVNVASLAGLVSMDRMPAYYATKHFAVALSESVFYDLQARNSNVGMSVFCPGYIQTDLHHCERHRPERFKAPDDPYYSSERYKEELERAEFVISTGTPLEPVGKYVFDAISEGRFYIEPHPEAKILVNHRNKNIVKERNPNYQFVKDIDDRSHGDKSFGQLMRIIKNK